MTQKRFKVQNMLKDFIIGDDTDLETLQELVEEYDSTAKIELFITDNGRKMTYCEVETLLNTITEENKQLKQLIKDCIDKAKWFNNEIDSLFEENKKLKQEIQQLKNNVSTN